MYLLDLLEVTVKFEAWVPKSEYECFVNGKGGLPMRCGGFDVPSFWKYKGKKSEYAGRDWPPVKVKIEMTKA